MRRAIVSIALGAVLAVTGCRTATVYNVPRSPIGARAPVTDKEVSEAIGAAGRREGWRVREVAPGQIKAEKTVRTHRAMVRINYDTTGYSITLVEADNLLFDGTSIHKTYNLWVQQLDKSIQDELRFRFG